ncbi:MAG: AMP-binding protein [Flavobacteriales bacterium]|jgi:phenylacetate-CoA ligase|nr:AMP-binding protein [Flavobacteriales bacterium]MBK7752913.1 AMP-binding protein [Flavobacteriales bacterium]MBK9076231.1 AMP-binding protein [Flavobacteriales bacterium]MBK9540549.1 AMP-binding protein [Flavobacteriales bacterium]
MRAELSLPSSWRDADVEVLQLAALRKHLGYVLERSPYYQKALDGLRIEDVQSPDHLRQLPFTRNSDLEAYNEEFLCVPKRAVVDHVTTSGTTGRPVALLLDEPDLERLTANEHNSLLLAGVTPDDVVQLMTTMDRRFMAGLAYFLGARSLGAGVVRVGPGAAALQWESIHRFGTTVLITVPSFLVRMLEHAKTHGIDPTASDVRKAICIGEPIRDITGSWNNLGARIKDQWNIELLGTYASTEMATACSERQEGSGHAVQPQLVLVEVLDEQDRPVADGAAGEVVVTPFHVSAMPLLRYRTGDICTWHKNARHGSGVGVHLGPVLGRMQHRLKVRGTTLFPAQVLDTINAMPAIPNFVVVCTTDELGGDDLEILVDLEMDEAERMREHLRGLLRVAPRVTPLPAAAIETLKWPKDSRKPHLFIDRRSTNRTTR